MRSHAKREENTQTQTQTKQAQTYPDLTSTTGNPPLMNIGTEAEVQNTYLGHGADIRQRPVVFTDVLVHLPGVERAVRRRGGGGGVREIYSISAY